MVFAVGALLEFAVVIVVVVASVVFGVVDDLVWTAINAVAERTTKRVLGGD